MNKFYILLFTLTLNSCSAKEAIIDPIKPNLETMTFDVVQKILRVEQDLPDNVQMLVSQWFDNKVKINGFDGQIIFTISNYNEEISIISDGKRVDINLYFKLILTKPTVSQKKFIEGYVSSYGTLTGDFSLSDFDTVIQNTQSDLILRLSRDLKSKI